MPRHRPLMIILALCCAAPGPGSDAPKPVGGTVTGRVLLVKDGKPIPPEDVFVYLEELHPKFRSQLWGDGQKAQIVQQGESFVPHAMVVPVGTEIAFPNLETNKEHNVFSPSDPTFDLGRYNQNKRGKTHVFKDTGEIQIFCDIHPGMWARVNVVESAWIARVGSDGKFTLTGVPAGKYKIVAWVHDTTENRRWKPIVVTEGGTLEVEEIHLQLGEFKLWHLRKDRTPYPCPPGYPKC